MAIENGMAELLEVLKLAGELCTAVDLAAEDIGGARPTDDILRELGPAIDAANKRLGLAQYKGTLREPGLVTLSGTIRVPGGTR